MSILVITPTTGAPELKDAVESVVNQTIDVDHLIIVDGEQFSEQTNKALEKTDRAKILRLDIPFNTGGGGFYGHRIMAAFGHLINHDYVLFLDQDNWFEPNHVETLVNKITKLNYDWVYSLRKVYDKDKNYITDDNCESLGRWPVWVKPDAFLIDSSSYCFKTEFFRKVCHIWDYGWGADRRFYTIIKDQLQHKNYSTTGLHTLCYRLGGNEGSVNAEFFEQGNKITHETFNGKYPWHEQVS